MPVYRELLPSERPSLPPEFLRNGPGFDLRVDQIGILVDDLESAALGFGVTFGVEEWRAWTYGPELVPTMTYHGEPTRYEMRLALSGANPQLELIEPVRGPTIYHDWIGEHGYGLHHVGVFVETLGTAVDAFEAAGLEPIQTGTGYGLDGDGGFAYFDTVDALGVIVELIEVPARRRDPHHVWRRET